MDHGLSSPRKLISALPPTENALRQTASFLPSRDLVNLIAAGSSTRASLAMLPQIPDRVLAVNTRAAFMQLLGPEGTQIADVPNNIRGLPLRLRAAPLSALASRIHTLPLGEKKAMTTEFLTAFNEIPADDRSTPLNAMARVAEDNLRGVSATVSVRRGANSQYTALFYGMTQKNHIEDLESSAVFSQLPGSAGAAVREGGNVKTVAHEFGIFSNSVIEKLEFHAANSMHPSAARTALDPSKSNIHEIAERFGLTESGIKQLGKPHDPNK
jgi:hypothetical protein